MRHLALAKLTFQLVFILSLILIVSGGVWSNIFKYTYT